MVEFKADNIRYEIQFKKHSDEEKEGLSRYTNYWRYTGCYDNHSYSKSLAVAKALKENPDYYDVTLVTITEERERV